ncbi:LytR/AlgR family response regulator transcription factor [Maricaulis maris]|uniref:Two-component system LytT family response regulator n=1 Tax=Maricaulis maris TaxID=74318 RepID=A0A495D278_9PROT|nr:LytTR family DNA-binding domain-containing protein [Maricaulis maris]RKQ95647.1 two-component system LytT family response regulator [Maricaulis maris]
MMRYLILDQREKARSGLERQLARYPNIECLGSHAAPGNGDVWHGTRPDIVFLGSDLPGLETLLCRNGNAGHHTPVVVMLGDLPVHALTAIELQVTDFLLRPVDTIRLEECLRRVRLELQRQRDLAQVDSLSETLAEIRNGEASANIGQVYRDFWIRSLHETVRVPQSSIIWIEAARGYSYFNLEQRQLLHRISLLELESRLDPAHFLRVHRSAIVNVHYIVRTQANRHGTYQLSLANGEQVRIGRKYRNKLADYMAGRQGESLVAA